MHRTCFKRGTTLLASQMRNVHEPAFLTAFRKTAPGRLQPPLFIRFHQMRTLFGKHKGILLPFNAFLAKLYPYPKGISIVFYRIDICQVFRVHDPAGQDSRKHEKCNQQAESDIWLYYNKYIHQCQYYIQQKEYASYHSHAHQEICNLLDEKIIFFFFILHDIIVISSFHLCNFLLEWIYVWKIYILR